MASAGGVVVVVSSPELREPVEREEAMSSPAMAAALLVEGLA